MAFKSAKAYNEQKYNGKFVLADDGDEADVIFLYRNYDDVLLADVHYIKSAEYSGYVQCTGKDCPVCATGKIRVQNKLFIPVYNLTADELQFWDRSARFEQQLNREVFRNYENPINYVFRITRKGEAGSMDTKYSINVISKNSTMSYEQILAKFGVQMPQAYERICRDYSAEKLRELLSRPANSSTDDDLPDYTVTPRGVANNPFIPQDAPSVDDIPEDDDVHFGSDEEIEDDVKF